jgi:hypothetical protein
VNPETHLNCAKRYEVVPIHRRGVSALFCPYLALPGCSAANRGAASPSAAGRTRSHTGPWRRHPCTDRDRPKDCAASPYPDRHYDLRGPVCVRASRVRPEDGRPVAHLNPDGPWQAARNGYARWVINPVIPTVTPRA